MKISILYEDQNFLALNKASGIHSVRGKSTEESVEDWLSQRPGQAEIPEHGILHRLDYKTSGVLLVAKTLECFDAWAMRIRAGIGLQKIYWAFATQKPSQLHFDFYFSSRYRGSKKITVKDTGKENERGRCQLKILHTSNSGCLIEVEILGPGRRHQIRAGLSEIGCPLIGDELYGGPSADFFGLHSKRLSWDQKHAEAPLPENWKPLPAKFFEK